MAKSPSRPSRSDGRSRRAKPHISVKELEEAAASADDAEPTPKPTDAVDAGTERSVAADRTNGSGPMRDSTSAPGVASKPKDGRPSIPRDASNGSPSAPKDAPPAVPWAASDGPTSADPSARSAASASGSASAAPASPAGSAASSATDTPEDASAAPTGADQADHPAVPEAKPPIDPTAPLTDDDCVRVAEWHDGKLRQWRGFGDLRSELHDPDTTVWVDLTAPPPAHVAEIARLLGLHPLIAEDILEGNQRAKIEVTDKLCHIVMFALQYQGEMLHTEIDFVLGRQFLLTVHEDAWDPYATSHLREGLAPILTRGSDHLLWALVDALVDSYFPFIDQMGDEVDAIEDQVATKAEPKVLQRLFSLKKDLLTARRAAAPVREIFNQLTNRDLALIDRDEVVYFRDVYDHLIRLTDELDNYRELVSSALDVYLSTVNNNLSLIMKRLTGVTVLLAGVGAIAGIFGMSEAGAAFKGAESLGFWVVAVASVLIALGMYALFRKIGWI